VARRPSRGARLGLAVIALVLSSTACESSGVSAPPTTPSAASASHPVPPGSGAAITGVLYYDRNQDGAQASAEPGVAGVPVYLSRTADSSSPAGEKAPATTSDEDGRFTLQAPDQVNGYRVEIRTGWARSQCDGPTCAAGPTKAGVASSGEWIYSDALIGSEPHTLSVGLIPDAGQIYVGSAHYRGYPPDLNRAHAHDLAARLAVDPDNACTVRAAGTTCALNQTVHQTLYIANQGTDPVTDVQGVVQIPYGEEHQALTILRSGTSPGIERLTIDSTTVATQSLAANTLPAPENFTTVRFTLTGSIPPGGLVSLLSTDRLIGGSPGGQLTAYAGVTAENARAADQDSAFCSTPAFTDCLVATNTNSLFDQRGDDNDSARLTIGPTR